MMPAVTTDDNFRQKNNLSTRKAQTTPPNPARLTTSPAIIISNPITQNNKAVITLVKISEFFIQFQNVVFPALCQEYCDI